MPKKAKENIVLEDISIDDIQNEISSLVNDHIVEGKKISWDTNQTQASNIDFSIPAPNIIEWSTGENFLSQPSLFEYKRQYQTIRDLFNLRCVICNPPTRAAADCWDKGREYLESENLLTWSHKYQDDVCPKCGTTRSEFEEDKMFQRYKTFVACVGMRSGKSVMAGAYLGTYYEHRIITLGDPATYFNTFPGQPFEVAFTATTSDQAKGTIYAYYRNARSKSPWINAYVDSLRAEEDKKGLDKNTLYKEVESSITYKNINVEFNSLNSNSSGLAGRTRLWACIDELSRFDVSTEGSKRSANEVWNVLDNSLTTVRAVVDDRKLPYYFGMMAAVSSPISYNDMTMRTVKDAKRIKEIFAVKYPTWEFNPKVSRATLEHRFKRDPIGSERDFGANPPMAESPLIVDVERFKKCIDPTLLPIASFEGTMPVDGMGRAYVGKRLLTANFDTNNIHFIGGDAGKSKDSFSMVSAHGEYMDIPSQDGQASERKFVTVLDWALAIRPILKPRKTVYFDCSIDIIKNILKKQKIAGSTFDHWNSEYILQTMRNLQIDADPYQVKAEDYIQFVSDAYEGKVKLIAPAETDEGKDPYFGMSAYGRLIHEALCLERSPDLKKVDHKQNEHNDIICCLVMAHRLVQNSGMTAGAGTGSKKANIAAAMQGIASPRIVKGASW